MVSEYKISIILFFLARIIKDFLNSNVINIVDK